MSPEGVGQAWCFALAAPSPMKPQDQRQQGATGKKQFQSGVRSNFLEGCRRATKECGYWVRGSHGSMLDCGCVL
jgi:hypothetical protein